MSVLKNGTTDDYNTYVDCTTRISTISTALTIYAELVNTNTDDESDDFQQFEK